MLRGLTAAVLTVGLFGAAYADTPSPADSQVTKFVGTLQQLADGGLLLKGIILTDGKIVLDESGTGNVLQLRAQGGTRQQRVLLPELVRLTMSGDPQWQAWQKGNRFAIRYDDAPADPDRQPEDPARRPQSSFEPPPPAENQQKELQQEAYRLRNRVQDRLEISPGMTGIVLTSPIVEESDNGGGRVVTLHGNLKSEDQRAPLAELLQETSDGIPYWRDQYDGVTFSVEELEVVPPSPLRRTRYTSLGMEYFRGCRLDEAGDAFTRALAENPGNPVLLYWRVLVHLAMGESDRAEAKLRYLLERNPQGQGDAAIALALESVQGPLRGQLLQMERDILLDRTPQYSEGTGPVTPLEPTGQPRPPAPGTSPPPPARPPQTPPPTSPAPPAGLPADPPRGDNGTNPPPAAPPAIPPSAGRDGENDAGTSGAVPGAVPADERPAPVPSPPVSPPVPAEPASPAEGDLNQPAPVE